MTTKSSYLRLVAGRPCLVAGDAILAPMYSETFEDGMHRGNALMAAAGIHVFTLIVRGLREGDYHTTPFWTGLDAYGDETGRDDGLSIHDQASAILDAQPDARFVLRWSSKVPAAWAEERPDDLQVADGPPRRESSYASQAAAEGRAAMARRIVAYVEKQAWADRVLGYLLYAQDEGTLHLVNEESMFDRSPVMRAAFRAFLAEAYGDDNGLQRAWGDPAVGLADVQAPTQTEWVRDRSKGQHWPDPGATRRYRDYFLCVRKQLQMQRRMELAAVRDAASRPVFAATDAFKQAMFGWLLRDAFQAAGDGMHWRNNLLASGSVDVGSMLDMPELDALVTPADYSARSIGFGWEPEGIGDSMVLRGKTIFIEDDARSWVAQDAATQGAWRDPGEARAGLLRNAAVAASRGFIPFWMNIGSKQYEDPALRGVIEELVPVQQRLFGRPHGHTEHAIAMIIDDTSPLEEDFTSGYQNLAVLRQRVDHLALTGLPYRVYLLTDLERDDFPVFRAYLLPNLFRLDPERLELIRARLMRNGSVVIFGPATGVSDGHHLSAEPAQALFGMPMELVEREVARRVMVRPAPELPGLAAAMTYGDSHVYGPILQPVVNALPDSVIELGRCSSWYGYNGPGLCLRSCGHGASGNGLAGVRAAGDCALVFSMAVPLPAAVLRALAILGGCNPWSALGDVVAADAHMVAVHSAAGGPRQIRLPEAMRVVDAVSGVELDSACRTVDIALESPDTRILLTDHP
jgi:hypothetical protein